MQNDYIKTLIRNRLSRLEVQLSICDYNSDESYRIQSELYFLRDITGENALNFIDLHSEIENDINLSKWGF